MMRPHTPSAADSDGRRSLSFSSPPRPPASPSRTSAAVPPSSVPAWVPAQLASPSKQQQFSAESNNNRPRELAVPRELVELAKQLELVERQRRQLLLRSGDTPAAARPASPMRRPQSPAVLAPLVPSHLKMPLASAPSLGLAPTLAVSDLVVCDLCSAELASATHLRGHQASACPQRVVSCPRAGCCASFPACERASHDRDACKSLVRTRQLLDEHAVAHSLVACEDCAEPVERRARSDHRLLSCVKRLVACQFAAVGCAARFAFDQQHAHEANDCRVARRRARIRADAVSVNDETTCDWCEQRVLRRKLLDHQEEECPKRERPCPNAANGCNEWVPVDETDRHVKTQCVVTRERDAMAARAREMNALVVCAECGGCVKRRYATQHATAACAGRVVACKNAAHGCRARLRWRDRHLHEDFLALASRERSMLHFPVGGRAYVALQSETSAQLERRVVDLPPPWTLELFLWVVDAPAEILDLHAQCLEFMETVVAKQREHGRFVQQAKACKKKLQQLQQLRKRDTDSRSNSALLGDVALTAKALADEFNAADTGVDEAARAIALARGHIQILVVEAHRLLQEERRANAEAAQETVSRVAAQALKRMGSRELLGGEFLSEDEQLRLGDIELWAAAARPATAGDGAAASAERQAKAAEQRRLLTKRAALAQTMHELQQREADGAVDEQEAARLRRRHERELAKLEVKLALVSDNTPTALLDRRGRHVVASSSRNAIVLVGAGHGQIAYYRSASSTTGAKAARGEVNFQVALARNRWHHVAFCASKSELTLVVDGEAKAARRGVFELPFARLGSNDARHGESFQGFLQEVRVWSSCLSVEYVRAHAGEIVSVRRHQGDLLAYYTLEEGAGDVVDDMALRQPRAPCFHTQWVLYDSAAVRQKLGPPPTPSLRDKTSCVVNQRLKLLAQRAQDRATEPMACRLGCGLGLVVRELDLHQRTQCVNRLVACREVGCEGTYRVGDVARHLATACERHALREALVERHHERETLAPCLLSCGARVKRRHAERHYTGECPNRLVACPQRDCGESIVARGLARHLASECQSQELVAERKMVANARRRQQANAQEMAG